MSKFWYNAQLIMLIPFSIIFWTFYAVGEQDTSRQGYLSRLNASSSHYTNQSGSQALSKQNLLDENGLPLKFPSDEHNSNDEKLGFLDSISNFFNLLPVNLAIKLAETVFPYNDSFETTQITTPQRPAKESKIFNKYNIQIFIKIVVILFTSTLYSFVPDFLATFFLLLSLLTETYFTLLSLFFYIILPATVYLILFRIHENL